LQILALQLLPELVTGTHYLGGFVGKELVQNDWIVKQAKKWADAQEAAYTGLQK
jgi:hypothetical protein